MEQFYLCNSEILGLSKSTVKVYSFLRMVSNQVTNASYYKKKNIASLCRVSESTVVRAIRELCAKGLLEVRKRFLKDGKQTSNLYILLDNPQTKLRPTEPEAKIDTPKTTVNAKAKKTSYTEPQDKIHLFKCRSSAFAANLSSTELKVYTYLSLRSGKGSSCFPSKKEIAVNCSISLSTLSRTLRKLRRSELLEVRPQTREKLYGNNGASSNLYILKDSIPSVPTNDPNTRGLASPKTGLKNVIISMLLLLLTPSPMSPVTPQRTMSRKKVTLKQRKEDLSSKLAKRILLHKHKFCAWSEIILAQADDG